MKIENTHIIVTGGGSGLGEATAKYLASKGAKVSVIDLNEPKAFAVAEQINGVAVGADVTRPDVANAIDTLVQKSGDVGALINCAGIGTAARIVGRDGAMPLEEFERVIKVNLVGTFNMMRLVATRMTKAVADDDGERGVIVNTASIAAFDGQVGQSAYAASKGGIVSLALPAAREFSRFGIRVNTVAPGIFLTPLLAELPSEVQENISNTIPFPSRLGHPIEFAEAVRFCIETKYLNAEVIRLDGGVRLPTK